MNGGKRNRATDIFSFGCVLLEIYTVLALKSLMDFVNFRTDEHGSDAFHRNLSKVHEWVAIIKGNLQPRTKDFLEFLERLISESPGDRPTADEVFDRARKTQRDDDEYQTFCGACCQDAAKASDTLFDVPRLAEKLEEDSVHSSLTGVKAISQQL